MSKLRSATAVVGTTALLAVPLTTVLASPASAVERGGRCDGARFELSVEKDDGKFEVEADIDDAPRGSKWRIKLVQNGKVFVNVVRVARDDDDDRDGDISIDRDRRNRAGKDTFRMTVNKVGTPGSCSRAVVLR